MTTCRASFPARVLRRGTRDALRAQAVAARSYALTTDAGGALFDQYPDTRSQVYRGLTGEEAFDQPCGPRDRR